MSSEPAEAEGTTVSIGDASITEGDDGTKTLTFTVTRSDNTGDFTVDYKTSDASASAGSDYVGVTGAPNTLTFTAGGALVLMMIRTGKGLSDIDFHFSAGFGGLPPGEGYPLAGVYLAWLAVILILYPLCLWYHRYKGTRKHWWLSYL